VGGPVDTGRPHPPGNPPPPYRALTQFRGDAQFYTWLYRIAVNTAKKQLLELKRDPVIVMSAMKSSDDDETSSADPEPNQQISDAETPEALLASKEIAAAVNAAMEALPVGLCQAITPREHDGLGCQESPQPPGCTTRPRRRRIFRAREAISARIKPMLENQSGKRW